MKSFLIALLLFSVMLGGIFLCERYLSGTKEALLTSLEECIPDADGAVSASALNALNTLWEENRERISHLLPIEQTKALEDALRDLTSAVKHQNLPMLDEAYEALRDLLSEFGKRSPLSPLPEIRSFFPSSHENHREFVNIL